MADPVFFKNAGGFSLEGLAKAVKDAGGSAELHNPKNANLVINDVADLDSAKADAISFLNNSKYLDSFGTTNAGACIISSKFVEKAPEGIALLISDDSYHAYAIIAAKFYPQELPEEPSIHPRAVISDSATIGKSCIIAANVVIGDGVTIGDNCIINPSVNISHAIIGNNVIIHHGACIGQDGFGFAPHNGVHVKIPQLGRVIIKDNVEIGAGTCIDRGSGPDTIIGSGTKIDNMVQIGHNVQLGKGCIMVAYSGIAGSTTVEDYVVIGGQVGISGHLTIGRESQIAAQSGVMRSLPEKSIVCGTPAVPIKQFHRQVISLQNLVKTK